MTQAEKCKLKLHILILKIRIFYNKTLMLFYLFCRNCIGLYFKFIKYYLGVFNE
jgi:hypothetical protein